MTQTNTPIYHAVAEDLGVFPLAMKQRDHAQFMRDHDQAAWLADATDRAYGLRSVPIAKAKPARRTRKR